MTVTEGHSRRQVMVEIDHESEVGECFSAAILDLSNSAFINGQPGQRTGVFLEYTT